MTENKAQLKELLQKEKELYGLDGKYFSKKFRHGKSYAIYNALRLFRIYEFRCLERDKAKNPIQKRIRVTRVKLADRRRNLACERAGIELTPGMIGDNIRMFHSGIVIYGNTGRNCVFHGANVVGNNKAGGSSSVPVLGNNVEVGFGASILGDVTIADDCVIGAGAVVLKSFTEKGSVIAGVPAKLIGNIKDKGN